MSKADDCMSMSKTTDVMSEVDNYLCMLSKAVDYLSCIS